MKRRRIYIGVAVLAAVLIIWRAWGSAMDEPDLLAGYLEGETLFMSAAVSGTVTSVSVVRGQRVEAGTPLFAMDSLVLAAQRSQAEAQLNQAEAQVAVSKAKASQAEARAMAAAAQAERAKADLDRYLAVQHVDRQAVAQEQVDTARTMAANAKAQYEAEESDAKAEAIQVSASDGQVAQYQGALADVQARFEQLSPHAPSPGRVQDVFYQAGEWATANQPVISLLPDSKLKVRFFVSETQLPRYHFGDTVKFACDGCAAGLTAKVSYISPQPEFTPPVIYSRRSRGRLVFLVEAIPADAGKLAPGQPVEVTPLPGQTEARR